MFPLMHGGARYSTLRDYLRVLRLQKWLILALALLGAGAALGLALREDKVYVASSSLASRDIVQEFTLIGEQAVGATPAAQLAALTADLATRTTVASGARRRLASQESIDRLQRRISTRVDTRTNLVILDAEAPTAVGAARIANAFAAETVAVAREREGRRLQAAIDEVVDEVDFARIATRRGEAGADIRLSVALQRLSQLRAVNGLAQPVEVVQQAAKPSQPRSPRPVRDAILGGLLGLVGGIVLAFGRDALDRRMRTAGDVQSELGLPVLARVSNGAMGTTGLLSPNGKVDPSDLEAFRMLRTNLQFLDTAGTPRVVLVTSGLPEEGKSTVAASLAAAAATAGRRVLLIEADLRRPSLGKRLDLADGPGLSDYLAGDATPEQVLRTIELPPTDGPRPADDSITLNCIAAGTIPARPAELLGSERCRALIEEVSGVYDLVVCDTSPLLSVSDTFELIPVADALIVCFRARRSTRDQARAVKEALARVPRKPTGVVLTGLRGSDDETYSYYSSVEPATVR